MAGPGIWADGPASSPLNAALLRRLWSYLWLPPAIRQMWQSRFADLAAIDALAASA